MKVSNLFAFYFSIYCLTFCAQFSFITPHYPGVVDHHILSKAMSFPHCVLSKAVSFPQRNKSYRRYAMVTHILHVILNEFIPSGTFSYL